VLLLALFVGLPRMSPELALRREAREIVRDATPVNTIGCEETLAAGDSSVAMTACDLAPQG
jgi:hypothetical protein